MQTMTEQERLELQQTGELRLLDPETSRRYIVVQEDVYDKIKEAVEIRATYPAVIRALDLEPDPGRGAYNDLRRK